LSGHAPVHFAVFVSPEPGPIFVHFSEVVMSIERTLSIVKPDGVGRNLIGECIGVLSKWV